MSANVESLLGSRGLVLFMRMCEDARNDAGASLAPCHRFDRLGVSTAAHLHYHMLDRTLSRANLD
jgi:hypothetical protein